MQVLKETSVISTPCVPTLTDPTSAVVLEVMKEMAETVQV